MFVSRLTGSDWTARLTALASLRQTSRVRVAASCPKRREPGVRSTVTATQRLLEHVRFALAFICERRSRAVTHKRENDKISFSAVYPDLASRRLTRYVWQKLPSRTTASARLYLAQRGNFVKCPVTSGPLSFSTMEKCSHGFNLGHTNGALFLSATESRLLGKITFA